MVWKKNNELMRARNEIYYNYKQAVQTSFTKLMVRFCSWNKTMYNTMISRQYAVPGVHKSPFEPVLVVGSPKV